MPLLHLPDHGRHSNTCGMEHLQAAADAPAGYREAHAAPFPEPRRAQVGETIILDNACLFSSYNGCAFVTRRCAMPHIIVKLFPGRTDEQKKRFAEEMVKDAVEILKCDEKSLSIAFEEIDPAQWDEKVYRPDVLGKKHTLYREPG
jgi:4-oxalocrotonate tautomerase